MAEDIKKNIGEDIAEESLEDISVAPDDAPVAEEKSETKMSFNKQEKTDKPYWYVVYTYSGYENKVKTDIEKTVENLDLHDTIFEVKVPMEDTIEVRNGKKKHIQRKLFPGYVMIKMFMTDQTWYVVRNTHGVTGFVGPGSKPIPLSDNEVRFMELEDVQISLDVEVGDEITIISGPFEGFGGKVTEINTDKQKMKVIISMFGRDTSVELDFVQVKKL